jgi:hypothetical protein
MNKKISIIIGIICILAMVNTVYASSESLILSYDNNDNNKIDTPELQEATVDMLDGYITQSLLDKISLLWIEGRDIIDIVYLAILYDVNSNNLIDTNELQTAAHGLLTGNISQIQYDGLEQYWINDTPILPLFSIFVVKKEIDLMALL